MEIYNVREDLKNIYNEIKNYEKDFINDLNILNEIKERFKNVELNYRNLYQNSHKIFNEELQKGLEEFKNSDHYKLIELLYKNSKLRTKINNEIKLDNEIKKIKPCNKTAINSIFEKNRMTCKCKYSLFDSISPNFTHFRVSIETLLDPIFSALYDDAPNEFKFLNKENKITEFLRYLERNSDKLNDILEKFLLKVENKSIMTINLLEIIRNLKGKYKKSKDFIDKLNDSLRKKENSIKSQNKGTEIIFEYEL